MLSIGIDIGGTSIKGAAVNSKGKVFECFNMPIDKTKNQDETIADLIALTKEYIETHTFKEKIKGIGIGIPGSIDTTNGVVCCANNLGWLNLPIVEKFKKELDYPVKITNDANAAALGENMLGAGKEYNDMLMITLGTGVGSGIIIGGKIYEGLNGKGAELGHSTLIMDGIQCTCGRKGCFEQYASATALIRQTKEAMEEDKSSMMWKIAEQEGKVNGKVAFEAAKLGDKKANEVVEQYVKYLSEGLLNVCNIFRPECIVLSGGIANQGDYLVSKIKTYCEKFEYGYPLSPITIIKIAELGYESGIIGAACQLFTK